METQFADALGSTKSMSPKEPIDWYAGPIFTSRSANAALVVISSAPTCHHLALKYRESAPRFITRVQPPPSIVMSQYAWNAAFPPAPSGSMV